MSENEVEQTGNLVGGDQAGRDINKTYHNHFPTSNLLYIKNLNVKFKKDQEENKQLSAFIEELEHFNTPRANETIIGLENKLIAGNRQSFIDFAKDHKDRFHRKLFKFQFSEAAQKINCHLLALVELYFLYEIHPLICQGEADQIINSKIIEKIITPLLNELDENLLGYSADDINGMIYFLTGNCYIKWIK